MSQNVRCAEPDALNSYDDMTNRVHLTRANAIKLKSSITNACTVI